MQSEELSFSADCVINFDDLGEYKDYSESVGVLFEQLSGFFASPVAFKEFPPELDSLFNQVLQADPEDVFHLPEFQKILTLLVGVQWRQPLNQECLKAKLIKLYFLVMEEFFLSYTFKEETCEAVMDLLIKDGQAYQFEILTFLYKICDKVVYIDRFDELLAFLLLVDETIVWGYKTDNEYCIAMYLQIVDKLFRSRKVRESYKNRNQEGSSKNYYRKLKFSLWSRDGIKIKEAISQIESICKDHQLLKITVGVISQKY